MAIVVPTPNTTITSAWGKSVADALNLWPRPGAGAELAFAQTTTAVVVTATTPGSSHLFVDAGAATYDGSPVMVEVYCPYVTSPAGGGILYVGLSDGATMLTQLGGFSVSGGAVAGTGAFRYRLTPTAGSHTYKAWAWVNTGTGRLDAGGAWAPGFIRVTRA